MTHPVGDKAAPCPLDHVNRQFLVERPNLPWVSDFVKLRSSAEGQYRFTSASGPCERGGSMSACGERPAALARLGRSRAREQ